MSIAALTRASGVSERTYRRARDGTHKLTRGTLEKLCVGLARLDGRPPPALHVVAALHRSAMREVCRRLVLDAEAVLATDFSKQNSVNRDWLEAARVRRLAMYLVVTELDVTSAALAAAIGITKQGVGKALRDIEDLRERDPLTDLVLEDVAALMVGRGPPAQAASGRAASGSGQE